MEEESSAQAWMDDYTNLSVAVADLLGVPPEEFADLDVEAQVASIADLAARRRGLVWSTSESAASLDLPEGRAEDETAEEETP